jgi:hypothetical protein
VHSRKLQVDREISASDSVKPPPRASSEYAGLGAPNVPIRFSTTETQSHRETLSWLSRVLGRDARVARDLYLAAFDDVPCAPTFFQNQFGQGWVESWPVARFPVARRQSP